MCVHVLFAVEESNWLSSLASLERLCFYQPFFWHMRVEVKLNKAQHQAIPVFAQCNNSQFAARLFVGVLEESNRLLSVSPPLFHIFFTPHASTNTHADSCCRRCSKNLYTQTDLEIADFTGSLCFIVTYQHFLSTPYGCIKLLCTQIHYISYAYIFIPMKISIFNHKQFCFCLF